MSPLTPCKSLNLLGELYDIELIERDNKKFLEFTYELKLRGGNPVNVKGFSVIKSGNLKPVQINGININEKDIEPFVKDNFIIYRFRIDEIGNISIRYEITGRPSVIPAGLRLMLEDGNECVAVKDEEAKLEYHKISFLYNLKMQIGAPEETGKKEGLEPLDDIKLKITIGDPYNNVISLIREKNVILENIKIISDELVFKGDYNISSDGRILEINKSISSLNAGESGYSIIPEFQIRPIVMEGKHTIELCCTLKLDTEVGKNKKIWVRRIICGRYQMKIKAVE